jgi:hypothetical protein
MQGAQAEEVTLEEAVALLEAKAAKVAAKAAKATAGAGNKGATKAPATAAAPKKAAARGRPKKGVDAEGSAAAGADDSQNGAGREHAGHATEGERGSSDSIVAPTNGSAEVVKKKRGRPRKVAPPAEDAASGPAGNGNSVQGRRQASAAAA